MLKFLNKTKNCMFFNQYMKSLKRSISSNLLGVIENIDNKIEKDVQHRSKIKLLPKAIYAGQNIVSLIYDELTEKYANQIQELCKHVHAPIIFNEVPSVDINEVLLSIFRNRVALALNFAVGDEKKSESFFFNNELDLYACIVNLHSIGLFKQRFKNVNITIVMQNNTGDYSKLEYEPVKGIVETLKMCHENNIKRVLYTAFEYAKNNKRKKITVAHKADEMPKTETRFVEIAKWIQKNSYPEIELNAILINTLSRKIVMCPLDFDVICCNEKYGTCLMSIISAICGNPNVYCASEIGTHNAVFKPLTNKISLNEPNLSVYGSIACCIQLLQYLGQSDCANNIENALTETIEKDKIITEKFGGKHNSCDVIQKVVDNLKNYVCQH